MRNGIKIDKALFCDCETDAERADFFRRGRAYKTGIVSSSIQMEVAAAFYRASFVPKIKLPENMTTVSPEVIDKCECHACIRENNLKAGDGDDFFSQLPLSSAKMILCPACGNKRCPKASDHRNACTASNEPNQAGSIY